MPAGRAEQGQASVEMAALLPLPAGQPRRMPAGRAEEGQASVEMAALLPLVVLVGALLWQAVVAGQALWLSGAAARAAARAAAVGGDAEAAARGAVPPALERGLRVRASEGGAVRVSLRVPSVLTNGTLTTVESRAAFPKQAP
jgi:hypothetical protein